MAAKRSCNLEFLLPYYENLIEKEVKKEEEKEKNKENEEKIEEIFKKIYEKYNEKYKEIIKNNKGRVEALYDDFPRELPKHVPISVTRRDFFGKLFARREKKEEVPVEFILANKDKKWFRRKATNKKYYEAKKPSSLPSSFFNAGVALGGVYSSLCEDMLAIKKEEEEEKEKEKNKEKEEKVEEEEEESSEEDDLDEEIKKINDKLDLWRMTPKYDRLHNKKMKLLQRKKRREERKRRREEKEEEERSQRINEIMGDFAKRTKKEEEEEEEE